jgi:hypothetical protein
MNEESLWKVPLQNRGIALPMALGAIVMIGALVASSFFSSSVRSRIGSAAIAHARAIAATDQGENDALASIDAGIDSLPVGQSTDPVHRSVPGGTTVTTTVTRLQQNLFLLVTEGATGSPGGAGMLRRTGLVFRMITVPADSGDSTVAMPFAVRVSQRGWVTLF